MVATDEVSLALLDNVPVLLEVLKLVAVGSGKVGAHAAIVAGDNDTATAGGLLLVVAVADLEAGLLGGIGEDLTVLVLADTAEVDDGRGREDVLPKGSGKVFVCVYDMCLAYLGTASGVLGGTPCGKDGVAVLEDCMWCYSRSNISVFQVYSRSS